METDLELILDGSLDIFRKRLYLRLLQKCSITSESIHNSWSSKAWNIKYSKSYISWQSDNSSALIFILKLYSPTISTVYSITFTFNVFNYSMSRSNFQLWLLPHCGARKWEHPHCMPGREKKYIFILIEFSLKKKKIPYQGKPLHNLPWSSRCKAELTASEPADLHNWRCDCWIQQQIVWFLQSKW